MPFQNIWKEILPASLFGQVLIGITQVLSEQRMFDARDFVFWILKLHLIKKKYFCVVLEFAIGSQSDPKIVIQKKTNCDPYSVAIAMNEC
jgi:hypothetical protein